MKETLRKSSDSAEQQTTQRYYENKNFYPNHDRRGLKAGIGVFAAGAVLIAGGYGVSKFNAEAEPAPGTSTEDVIDHDPTGGDPTDLTSQAPEELTLENFSYTLNGEKYTGIEEFTEALLIPTTPVDQYPGTFSSEERYEAIQEDFQPALVNWVELGDQFINYELDPKYYDDEYADLEYTDSKGRTMWGANAVRALYIAPAFERAMLHESSVAHTPYPSEFMEDLTYTASRINTTRQYSIEDGETPYEAHLVIDDMQFGGIEIVGHDDYAEGVGISGSGTVTLRLDTNQGEGNTAPFDLLGGSEEDVDYFSTTDSITLRIEANGGTGSFKVTYIELQ